MPIPSALFLLNRLFTFHRKHFRREFAVLGKRNGPLLLVLNRSFDGIQFGAGLLMFFLISRCGSFLLLSRVNF